MVYVRLKSSQCLFSTAKCVTKVWRKLFCWHQQCKSSNMSCGTSLPSSYHNSYPIDLGHHDKLLLVQFHPWLKIHIVFSFLQDPPACCVVLVGIFCFLWTQISVKSHLILMSWELWFFSSDYDFPLVCHHHFLTAVNLLSSYRGRCGASF